MSYLTGKQKILPARIWMIVAFFVLVTSVASCNKSQTAQVVQKTFASPADAGAAFLEGAKSGDQKALIAIFGPETDEVLHSGDAARDENGLRDFVAAYNQMNRWGKIQGGGQILYVGADNYPFPIPLQQNSSGQWYFNTAAGKDEILARRIGKGELTAIAACGAIAGAEQQYFSQTHDGEKVKQYAQKFVSDPGKQNGLYWSDSEGQNASPLGQLGDFAKAMGYTNAGDNPQLFNGYYYRMLTKQRVKAGGGVTDFIVDGKMTGGFAVVAYPEKYGDSGIMTFIVGKDGIVYQKNLGEKTSDVAVAMEDYDPSDGWNPAI